MYVAGSHGELSVTVEISPFVTSDTLAFPLPSILHMGPIFLLPCRLYYAAEPALSSRALGDRVETERQPIHKVIPPHQIYKSTVVASHMPDLPPILLHIEGAPSMHSLLLSIGPHAYGTYHR